MFSSTIKISSVSDYIQPSQECIKPLMDKVRLRDVNDLTQAPQAEILMKPDLIKKNLQQVAKVSLSDCLACSGCITTAETLLIETHSVQEFMNKLQGKQRTIIALSPQSRASIAVYFKLSDLQAHQLIQSYFDTLNKNIIVIDMHSLIELTLQLSKNEFLSALKQDKDIKLPLICSECPGWVCYAEKTLEPWIIQHMSCIKSPQQLFGKLMGEWYCAEQNLDRDSVYLVTVMPCFDKKLESVRQQNAGEIDTVLSSGELLDLLKDQQINPQTQLYNIEELIGIKKEQHLIYFNPTKQYGNDTSNRYLDHMIETFIQWKQLIDHQIVVQQRKNGDFIEIFVKQNNITIGIFARVYGLKNIANLVSQMKKVMACPSGCLNGGGQIKIKLEKDKKQKDYIQSMMDVLTQVEGKITRNIDENKLFPIIHHSLTTTSFQHVPKIAGNFEW